MRVAAVATEHSRTQQKMRLGQCGVFTLYKPNSLTGYGRPERTLSDCGPEGRGFEPVGHSSCANLAFATHRKEAPVFREYGLAPLAHECGVVTGAVMRLL